jgi:hypothetical protein
VERAADLKAQIDSDKRPDASVAPPDVETESTLASARLVVER